MINFTPGPSQVYYTVSDHIKTAIRQGVLSLSHRSKEFEKMYSDASNGLRELLNIPDTFTIVFASSATEIWERSIQNLVEVESCHFVNGAFSRRYHEIATQLNKKATLVQVEEGKGFSSSSPITPTAELLAITHNETSTGVSWNLADIYELRKANPHALLVIDAVSSLPYPDLDFSQIDSVFFSVQKAFGLPAGLGVWIVNDRCLNKANDLLAKGHVIGTYHNLPTLSTFAKKYQTPETPNVLGIYLLSKVVEDFARRGAQTLRRETDYKAAILYQALSEHASLKPFVENTRDRSKTVIVVSAGEFTKKLSLYLQSKGIYPGEGYGKFKDTQLRFANFPAHSKEQVELLVDSIGSFSGN